MKLEVSKQTIQINPAQFLRSLGWAQIYDRKRSQVSYVKRLGADFYPRLHLYVNELESFYVFSMHLDQKKASYSGQTAHSGEYDNDLVKAELLKLKNTLKIGGEKKY
ncbi:MAG: hypothetical protein K9M44_03250 [Candidatus Pacebacteria bacterium]|nr:hypothetical protein [Candidatus Paceibacterota bacterium]